jgi:hypothetical protein
VKVGRRRLVERLAPGPGRSPKADPRLGVVLYGGVAPIDVAGTIGRLDGLTGAAEEAGSPAPPRHLIETTARPSLPASPTPDPLFEVEHLGLRAEPEAQKELRREQRDVTAGGTIDLHKIALPEILDPRGVERKHWCAPCSRSVPAKRMGKAASMVDCRHPLSGEGRGAWRAGSAARPQAVAVSLLPPPGLAQPGEIGGFEQGACRRLLKKFGPESLLLGNANLRTIPCPPLGFGECGRG